MKDRLHYQCRNVLCHINEKVPNVEVVETESVGFRQLREAVAVISHL